MVGSAEPPQRVKLLSTVARKDSTKERDPGMIAFVGPDITNMFQSVCA